MNNTQIYEYLVPIVKGCSGFIKSQGYMTVENDHLILMSFDRSHITIVQINPLNLIFAAEIKSFINCKDDPESFITKTYSLGNYQLYCEMSEKYKQYWRVLVDNKPIYSEIDMYNIEGFANEILSNKISWIIFNDGMTKYKTPVSKWITQLNKGETCSLNIYDIYKDNTRLFNYIIHKNKLKVDAYLFTRQYILE